MEKRYELGLIATGLLTIIARYLPIKIPAKAEEKIERLEKSFANPELVDCYKKQLGLEKKRERNETYVCCHGGYKTCHHLSVYHLTHEV